MLWWNAPGWALSACTTLSTQRNMPQLGEQVECCLHHLNVREDAMDLFGFATMMELNCFKMLTAVSGVGPKVGAGDFVASLRRSRWPWPRRRGTAKR